jgi:hypothetical protein
MSTLTDKQHARLDQLADEAPDAKVVGMELNNSGQETPVVQLNGSRHVLQRHGHLHRVS